LLADVDFLGTEEITEIFVVLRYCVPVTCRQLDKVISLDSCYLREATRFTKERASTKM
jgi:hypothetical protein